MWYVVTWVVYVVMCVTDDYEDFGMDVESVPHARCDVSDVW